MIDSCCKAAAVSPSTKHSGGLVAALRFALIFCVLLFGNIAQIIKAIVRFVAVFMINLTCWPHASHVQPNKSMTLMQLVVDGSDQIPLIRKTAGYFSLTYARLFESARERPRFWVVIEHFFKSCLCKHPRTLTHFERA